MLQCPTVVGFLTRSKSGLRAHFHCQQQVQQTFLPGSPPSPPPALQVHYTNYPASLADWEHALPMQARFFNALKVRTPQAAGTGLA